MIEQEWYTEAHWKIDKKWRRKQLSLLLTSQLCMLSLDRSGDSRSLWENSVTFKWTHFPPQASLTCYQFWWLKKSCLRSFTNTLGKVDQFQVSVVLLLGRVHFQQAFRKSSCFYFITEPCSLLLFRFCQQIHLGLSSLRGETLSVVGRVNGRQKIDPNLCSMKTRNGVN